MTVCTRCPAIAFVRRGPDWGADITSSCGLCETFAGRLWADTGGKAEFVLLGLSGGMRELLSTLYLIVGVVQSAESVARGSRHGNMIALARLEVFWNHCVLDQNLVVLLIWASVN